MNKITLLSLLLVVGMTVSAQDNIITERFYPTINYLLDSLKKQVLDLHKEVDSLKGIIVHIRNPFSVHDSIGFHTIKSPVSIEYTNDLGIYGDKVYLGGNMRVDTSLIGKGTMTEKQILAYRAILDSNGTHHDHMPTQLTVKKRHKRHKWVKRTPPLTKD